MPDYLTLPFALTLVAGTLVALSPAAVLVRDARRAVAPSTEGARALRHATLPAAVAAVTLLLGFLLVLAWAFFLPGTPARPGGRMVASGPLLAALVFLAVHAVGELTYPRPTGAVRVAGLTSRRVADVAPIALRRLTVGWAAALVLVLAAGAATATGPRHIHRTYEGWIVRADPYPGTWFAVPLGIGVVLTLGATHLVLRLVATRAAVAGVDEAWDLALRRRTAARVLRGVQLALGLTVAGVTFMAGAAIATMSHGPADHWTSGAVPTLLVMGRCLMLLAPAAVVVAVVVALRRGTAPLPTPTAPVGVDG